MQSYHTPSHRTSLLSAHAVVFPKPHKLLYNSMPVCSASLAPQASAEEVRHAPNSVMCSQVWTSLAANFTDHSKPPAFGAKKSFGRSAKASPEKNQCQVLLLYTLFQVKPFLVALGSRSWMCVCRLSLKGTWSHEGHQHPMH